MAKILIVDDDRHFIQQIRGLLSTFGYSSDFVTRAELLLPKLERDVVDLILLDVNMPDTDGVTQLKQIKAHPVYNPIPVIMLTVEMDEQLLANCFEYGATDFINKPVRALVLRARCQAALATQEYIKEIQQQKQALEHRTAELNQANEQLQQEITGRKQTEEELKEHREHLEELVEERTAKLIKANEQLQHEVAERKRAEEELQQTHQELVAKASQLEEANSELTQYAYVVSHDLKAPLRAIQNYTDFLLEDLEGTLAEEQEEYLNGLSRAVSQSEALVNALLEFSRIGQRGEPVEAIDIGMFLQELIAALDFSPEVEFVMKNDWPTMDADPTLLWQIFQNLIINAIKFNTSPRKRIEIGWLPAEDERYELFVRDNGIGIEPRHIEQIFRVFQRLHTTDEYEGTGIGLAIVKKAASQLDGFVRVESKPGEGSTFFVSLPKT